MLAAADDEAHNDVVDHDVTVRWPSVPPYLHISTRLHGLRQLLPSSVRPFYSRLTVVTSREFERRNFLANVFLLNHAPYFKTFLSWGKTRLTSGRITGGLRGPGPPERPDGPTKHLFWEGTRGMEKPPPVKLWWADDFFIDALLQFASDVLKLQCKKNFLPEIWLLEGPQGGLAIFYGSFINIIRPLVLTLFTAWR